MTVAFFYSLAIECGRSRADAEACAEHFAAEPARVAIEQDGSEEGRWWAVVMPRDDAGTGVTSPEVAAGLTAAGTALLERLRTAPPFRFAVPGVEAYESLDYDDMDESLGRDPELAAHYSGLVVAEDVYRRLGSPPAFEPFSDGRRWIPYRGESEPAA